MTKTEYIKKLIGFTMQKGAFEFLRGRGYLDFDFANDRIAEIESEIEALKNIGYDK